MRCIANSQSHNPLMDACRVGNGVFISVAFGGAVVGLCPWVVTVGVRLGRD